MQMTNVTKGLLLVSASLIGGIALLILYPKYVLVPLASVLLFCLFIAGGEMIDKPDKKDEP